MQQGCGIVVDFETKFLTVHGRQMKLYPTALRLLEYFISHRGQYRSKAEIALFLWGEDTPKRSRQIETVVRQIKAAVEKNPLKPKILLTKDRFSYIFDLSVIANPGELPGVIVIGDVALWPEGKRVFISGKEIKIGWQPFLVLHKLMEEAETCCPSELLLRTGWPGGQAKLKDLNEAIRKLRKMIERVPVDPEIILCVDKRGCMGCRGYVYMP